MIRYINAIVTVGVAVRGPNGRRSIVTATLNC